VNAGGTAFIEFSHAEFAISELLRIIGILSFGELFISNAALS